MTKKDYKYNGINGTKGQSEILIQFLWEKNEVIRKKLNFRALVNYRVRRK